MPFPIHRRVLLRCTSKGFTHSMVFAQTTGARLPLVLFRSFFTVRQDSLDVTACCFARSPFRATLSQGFNLRISPPVACQLRGDLALTSTGLSPARLCLAWLGAQNQQKAVFAGNTASNLNLLYPIEPSISNLIRRFISTAYSIGSSFVNGSIKPMTIICVASAWLSPRLIK
jgi:hypothetical protein